MRPPAVAAALGGLSLLGALVVTVSPPAAADTEDGPATPFVDRATWVWFSDLPTLRVYPTGNGRAVAGKLAKTAAQTEEAWREVLVLAPDADTPGMRAQFVCHWNFAELAHPGKTSWDLEPWRPDVDDSDMLLAGCNPGGAELG